MNQGGKYQRDSGNAAKNIKYFSIKYISGSNIYFKIFSSWLTDHLDNHQYEGHLTLPRQNGNSLLKVTFNLQITLVGSENTPI